MLENKEIKDKLRIAMIIMAIIEIIIEFMLPNIVILEMISNIILGIIGSLLVSYIIANITYNHKKEETIEILVKDLLNIYSKMVIFKCEYKQSKDKNEKIVKLQYDIDNFISNIYDIEYDLVKKLKCMDKSETITIKKYNEGAAKEIANGFEVKNGKIVNNAKGINNQKDFIESYNKMLYKIRDYLDKFCIDKYMVQFIMLKTLDDKYEEIESKSNKTITYKK